MMKFSFILAIFISITLNAQAQDMIRAADYTYPAYSNSAPIVLETTILNSQRAGNAAKNIYTYYMLHTGLICVGYRTTAKGGVDCVSYNLNKMTLTAFNNVCLKWNEHFSSNTIQCP